MGLFDKFMDKIGGGREADRKTRHDAFEKANPANNDVHGGGDVGDAAEMSAARTMNASTVGKEKALTESGYVETMQEEMDSAVEAGKKLNKAKRALDEETIHAAQQRELQMKDVKSEINKE